jgi:hypothetical protein
MPVRTPGALQKTRDLSPNDPIDEGGLGLPIPEGDEKEIYTVKLADTRATLARANLFSSVRYITADESGETKTERDFPMGDLRLETVRLVLTDWNLTNDKGKKHAITHDSVMEFIDPDVFSWLYTRIIEMNTVWGGAGEA